MPEEVNKEETPVEEVVSQQEATARNALAELTGEAAPKEPEEPVVESQEPEPVAATEEDSPSEQPAAEEEPATQLTDQQIRFAKELGYTDGEIAEETNGSAIEKAYKKYSQQMSKIGRQRQIKDVELSDTETPETFMPKMRAVLDEVKNLHSTIDRYEAERTAATIDNFFASMVKEDETLSERFGSGPMSELFETDEKAIARNKVIEEARFIKAGYETSGRHLTDQEALEKAFYAISKGEVKVKKAEKKAADKKSKVQVRGTTVKPASLESEDERAKKLFADFEQRQGIHIPP